eukprot:CAMPEP_0179136274 /NCGR_PEP_ID=MMETSP0796-20121207/64926_1 /TAXON_ID=73915 /ORGANISM="Pyrodinium bahamense, Strain pbaha01" /LENGTH=43 /DNA_ID= /DNA_START= /DNA_END= /DNA_ORIENTATION=
MNAAGFAQAPRRRAVSRYEPSVTKSSNVQESRVSATIFTSTPR